MAADRAPIAYERLPAARGLRWLRDAYGMLSRAWAPWLMLLVIYSALLAVIGLIAEVGPILALFLKPLFAVGFLAAAWSQERGERPRLSHLFAGFKSNISALLLLGVVFVAGIALAVLATALIDDGRLVHAILDKAKFDEEILTEEPVMLGMLLAVFCAQVVVLALWFAPALIVFQDCSAWRALGVSLRAAFANWRPILVYGLLLFFYGGVLPRIVGAAIAVVAPAAIAPAITQLLLLPYLFLFAATLYIADYVSYRDIFHHQEPAAPEAATPEP